MEVAATLTAPKRRSPAHLVRLFLMHQSIAWVGAPLLGSVALGFVTDLGRLFGWTVTAGERSWLLVGTPYFPVQILVAALLGWLLAQFLHHRSMVWVWVLPFTLLCAAFVLQLHVTPEIFHPPHPSVLLPHSRLAHFFGWGCQPQKHCLDQMFITMPFYSSAAYSIGAFWARRGVPPKFIGQFRELRSEPVVLYIVVSCLFAVAALNLWEFPGGWPNTPGLRVLLAGVVLVIVPVETAILAFAVLLIASLLRPNPS